MSGRRDDGGAAFPGGTIKEDAQRVEDFCLPYHGGMSLRDWFAGQALNGLVSRETDDVIADVLQRRAYPLVWAKVAYRAADALLAERQRREVD